jgi:acyl-CoA reductase-like NAD-dependent aldehyde dehydrogenase
VQATGQACQSLERVYVHESLHDAFVAELVRQAEQVELSFPNPDQGQMGPLIFAKQAQVIAAQIEEACSKGASLRCGGVVETLGGGLWIRPTVLSGVDHSMQVMKDETFGPVMPVMPYKTVDEAVALANDTDYGLSASVIGKDAEAAIEVGRRLNAGAISINDGGLTTEVHDAAHDSFGLSGMGSGRMGPIGLTRFMRRKALLIRQDEAKGLDAVDERLLRQNIED